MNLTGIGTQEEASEDRRTLDAEDRVMVQALQPGTGLLIVVQGPNRGARFLLDDTELSTGRGPDSPIFLDHVTVSRKHAVFARQAHGYAVHDAGSLNGTYVNGQLVQHHLLETGDEVQIGKFRLVYYAGGRPT